MTDLLGPANAQNVVTSRPADLRVFGSTDTFLRDCSSADARDGTFLGAAFLNGILQQFRRAIRGQNVTENNADDDMLLKAIRSSGVRWGVDTGAANAWVASFQQPVVALYSGLCVAIKLGHDTVNGGATLTGDAMTSTSVVWADGSAVAEGDLKANGVAFLVYDGAKFQIVNYRPPQSAQVPYNFFGGLDTTWVDGTHITVAPGACAGRNGGGLITLGSAITKDISASWAVGTAAGMRSAASLADGTWHLFLIGDSTGAHPTDVFADTSLTPTLPSGYNSYRRISSHLVASGSIVRYLQAGNNFWWYDPETFDYQASNYTTGNIPPTLVTISVPKGITVEAHLISYLTSIGGSATRATVWPTALQVPANNGSWFLPGVVASCAYGGDNVDDFNVLTDSNGQVRLAVFSTSSGFGFLLNTKGYVDRR